MDQRLLQTFIQVANTGSITKTAEHQHITGTALLKQVNQLEEQVGVQLFLRTHRGVSLTKAGESFYNDAILLNSLIEGAIERAHLSLDDNKQLTIRLGSSLVTPASYFKQFWDQIASAAGACFNVVQTDASLLSANTLLANLGKTIDVLADIYDQQLLDQFQCQALKLADLPLKCGIAPQNPLAARNRLLKRDFISQRVYLYCLPQNPLQQQIKQRLTDAFPGVDIVEMPELSTEMFNMAINHGAIVITTDLWSQLNPFLVVKDLPVKLTVPYGLLYAKQPSTRVKRLLAIMRAVQP
ncbi:MAG: LysR family transcriptional regulator [Limosilactobacillus sp.]